MDVNKFFEIINDKHFPDYKRLSCKYPNDIRAFFSSLFKYYSNELPLLDFHGNSISFIPTLCKQDETQIKILSKNPDSPPEMESEIIATSAIENINTRRESVRKILNGIAPTNSEEDKIYGLKKGFEFISNLDNKITEENFYRLYTMAIGEYLDSDNKLFPGNIYRNDEVYVVGDGVDHVGLSHSKLPKYMKKLFLFANSKDDIPSMIKASIIHFYIAFIHPYFDGNGRMARLVHLWFLIQRSFSSALFVPFSVNIEKTRGEYYKVFKIIEQNYKICGNIDVTPFIFYFYENIYSKIYLPEISTFYIPKPERFTAKEHELWQFVTIHYGNNEFSTKQLEKDSGIAAYATIRNFVKKFTDAGLLARMTYSNKNRYKIK